MNKQVVVAVAIAWCVIIALIFGAMHIPGVLAIIIAEEWQIQQFDDIKKITE